MVSTICFISPTPEYTILYNKSLGFLDDPPKIIDGASKALLPTVLEAQKSGFKIIVTSEYNARNLWGKVNIPVVAIALSAFQIARQLHRAKTTYGEPVAFLYERINSHLSALQEILSFEFKGFIFHSEKDCLSTLRRVMEQGFSSVVGESVPTLLSRRIGFPCVSLLPSSEDVLEAFYQAQQISDVQQIEQHESMNFRYVVQCTFSGIIVVDKEGIITVFNPAAERIFGIPANQALCQSLEKLFSQYNFLDVDKKERPQLDELRMIRQQQLLVNRIPIVVERKIIGTIFTFRKVSMIRSQEEKIRRSLHTKGLTAKLSFQDIAGDSKTIRETVSRAQRFASSDETILITGESGTGKEVFAQSIHNASRRCGQPFVAINCSSISPTLLESELFGYAGGAFTGARREGKLGVFELAHLGTIFLDEISELSHEAQAHMLRVLQEKEVMRVGDGKVTLVDVRVIVAANRPLEKAVQQGYFRLDLYHRMNVLQLKLPALREHPADVLTLASTFVNQWCPNQQLATKIIAVLVKYEDPLTRYQWPGNVRELQNLIRRAVALVGTMVEGTVEREIEDLLSEAFANTLVFVPPIKSHNNGNLKAAITDLEHEIITHHYNELRGGKAELAKRLGIGRTTLWRKLKGVESK